MKLYSCDNCGTVLDLDKINVPDLDYYRYLESIPSNKFEWDSYTDDYLPIITCPSCKERIKIIK